MDVKIVLSVREVFALTQAKIRSVTRRQIFGTVGLTKKIREQLEAQTTPQELVILQKEWDEIKTNVPDQKPKPRKVVPQSNLPKTHRTQTRVWP